MDYKVIITNVGATKISAAVTQGTEVSFLNFAVGDGNGSEYEPLPTQTALKNEVWRGGIATLAPLQADPTILEITTAIPANVGGFFIRELGIFDNNGDMIAIGNTPTIKKAASVDSFSDDLAIKVLLDVGAENAVTLDATSIAVASRADMVNLENRVNTTMQTTVTTVNTTMESTVTTVNTTMQETVAEVEADLAAHTTEIQQICDDAVDEVRDLGGYTKTEVDTLLAAKITAPTTGTAGQYLRKTVDGYENADLVIPTYADATETTSGLMTGPDKKFVNSMPLVFVQMADPNSQDDGYFRDTFGRELQKSDYSGNPLAVWFDTSTGLIKFFDNTADDWKAFGAVYQ